MKHASPQTLEALSSLLNELRSLPGITEKKVGIFYKNGKAFLHFHEDPAGLFADARLEDPDFTRFSVNSEDEVKSFLGALREKLT